MANPPDPSPRQQPPYDAIQLSKAISEKKQVRITFLDGDVLVDGLRWHTPYHLGMRDGKIVSRSAIKFFEVMDE